MPPSPSRSPGRHPALVARLGRGAIALAGALVISACGSDGAQPDPPPASAPAEPTDLALAMVEQFDQSLRALDQAYEFSTSIEVDGVVVTRIVGRSVDANSTSTSAAGSDTVEFIEVDSGAWIRTNGGPWTEVTSAPATHDPLTALFAVTQVSVLEGVMSIIFPGAALGLDADRVTAQVDVFGSTIVMVAMSDGVVGRTRLSPPADRTPLVAPV